MNDPPLLDDVELDIAEEERQSNVPREIEELEGFAKLVWDLASGSIDDEINDIPASLSRCPEVEYLSEIF